MFQIECPWCGKREQSEFSHGGEAHLVRPTGDGGNHWIEYLYFRSNTRGTQVERWYHAFGCRRWFNVARNTLTNEVSHVYPPGETPSELQQAK